jgi:hypothetical protein
MSWNNCPGVKQFRIKHQILPLSRESGPEVHARGMVKQQVALGVANELRYLTSHFAVRDLHSGNVSCCHALLLGYKAHGNVGYAYSYLKATADEIAYFDDFCQGRSGVR